MNLETPPTSAVSRRGQRGGLATEPNLAFAASRPAATRSVAPLLDVGALQRVAWTLPFAAFLLYIVAVVTNRFAIGSYAIPVALVGLLLQGKPIRSSPLVWLMTAYLAWGALGTAVSIEPSATLEACKEYGKLVLIVLAGVNALSSATQIRVYMAVVAISFIAYPGKGAFFNYVTGNLRKGRVAWSGIYGNPNDLAAIALLAMSVTIALLAFRLPRWARLATIGASGFIAFIILITQSRGALIALGIFGLGMIWRLPRRQRPKFVVGAVAAAGVLAFYAPAGVWDRLSGLKNLTGGVSAQVDKEGSAEQRIEIWKVAGTIIAENPITGVGLGSYPVAHGRTAIRPEFKRTAQGERDTHSTYLNVIAETGFVGLGIFLAIIISVVRFAERQRRRAARIGMEEARALLVLQLGFVAYMTAGIWGSFSRLHVPYLHLLLLWVLAESVRKQLAHDATGAPAPVR